MKMETKPKLSQKQVIKIQSLARTKNKSQTFHKNIKQKVSRFYKNNLYKFGLSRERKTNLGPLQKHKTKSFTPLQKQLI